MIPQSLNYIGQYESDMAMANSMTEYEVGSLIDTQWDYYSKTTNAILKMYHLASLNGFYQLWIRISGQIPWNYGLSNVIAVSEVKTAYTFTVTVPSSTTQFPVLIDGVYVGAAPVKISVGQGFLPETITPGQHIIEVRTAAYQPYKETITIPADANSTLTISPTFIPAEQRVSSYYKLNISSVPTGAAIIIDNKDTGLITNSWLRVDDTHIKPGQHLIRIYKLGYNAYNGPITVKSGQNTDLTFTLPKEPEPLADPVTVITPIVIIVANKYKITPGANVVIIHPNTFDTIVSESASMAAQTQTRTDVNWKDMAYNALVMKNIVRGYIPSLQEIYNTTDGFTLQNLKGRGVPIGQGFDTLDGSLYDEIAANTAKQTAELLCKKTGLTLSVNAMAFLTNDAKESLAFFGFKRGR
jgi:hypothetical protein